MRGLSVLPSTRVENKRDLGVSNTEVTFAREVAVQTVFTDISRVFGTSFVPDFFEGMCARPGYLETAWELIKDDLCLENLDGKTKRIIALALTTNEAGVYYLAALPHAFRLNALDPATCEKLLLTIRFFHTFERYLSGITPASKPRISEFVSMCLREEYQNYHVTSSSHRTLSAQQPAVPWIGGALVLGVLLIPVLVAAYLLFR